MSEQGVEAVLGMGKDEPSNEWGWGKVNVAVREHWKEAGESVQWGRRPGGEGGRKQ